MIKKIDLKDLLFFVLFCFMGLTQNLIFSIMVATQMSNSWVLVADIYVTVLVWIWSD